jgi:hypothetical protein
MATTDNLDKTISKNYKSYRRAVSALKYFRQSRLGLLIAQHAASIAANRHAGLFVSTELEEYLSDFSKKLKHASITGQSVLSGSTLHIMSRAYSTGGHTKVVERWASASHPLEVHSVLMTRPGEIPNTLEDIVRSKSGKIYFPISAASPVANARWIRSTSDRYENVVLHIHTDDIIPLLAFGDGSFRNNLFFYNHADHRFWLGATLAATFLELSSWGVELSQTERGISNSVKAGIPLGNPPHYSEAEVESLLRWSTKNVQDHLIVTVGNSKKYIATSELSFPREVASILEADSSRKLVAIGPAVEDNLHWLTLVRRFPNQVCIIPEIPHGSLSKIIAVADLVLESFPMAGGTVSLEALQLEVPLLSLQGVCGQLDEISTAPYFCSEVDDWKQKAEEILLKEDHRAENKQSRLAKLKTQRPSAQSWSTDAFILSETQSKFASHKNPLDYSELHRYLAQVWRSETRFRRLQQIFLAGFIGAGIKIEMHLKAKSVLTPEYLAFK